MIFAAALGGTRSRFCTRPPRFPGPLLLIVLAVGSVVILGATAGGRQALRTSFSEVPANYTELYFAHPDSLPTIVPVGSAVSAPFVIANHENRTVTYQYRTTLRGPGTDDIQQGIITMRTQETVTVSVVSHVRTRGEYVLTVNLVDRDPRLQLRVDAS